MEEERKKTKERLKFKGKHLEMKEKKNTIK